MDDKINIDNFKNYISNLDLNIKDKINLINFISSIKSEILNNLKENIEIDINSKVELISIFSDKKDYKNLQEILNDFFNTKTILEYINNQKNN